MVAGRCGRGGVARVPSRDRSALLRTFDMTCLVSVGVGVGGWEGRQVSGRVYDLVCGWVIARKAGVVFYESVALCGSRSCVVMLAARRKETRRSEKTTTRTRWHACTLLLPPRVLALSTTTPWHHPGQEHTSYICMCEGVSGVFWQRETTLGLDVVRKPASPLEGDSACRSKEAGKGRGE